MTFRLADHDGVAVLTLDRPPVNALDLGAVLALEAAFKDLAAAPPAAGMVLTGDDGVFSAGVDTRAFAADDPDERAAMIRGITRMVAALYALPFPVVAAVTGHALGGGLVLALAADLRLAVDDPGDRLGLTEAAAGVPFPAGPLEVIRAELPPTLLRRMTLTSAVLTPAELAAAGVIDRLTPRPLLQEAARAQAREMAAQPAFAAVKRQLREPVVERLAALALSGDDPLIA